MPSRSAALNPAQDQVQQSMTFNVQRDAPDLRDVAYRPSLRPLPRTVFPKEKLLRVVRRKQGAEGSCTGQALATVIDFLRTRSEPPPPDAVAQASARMIVELARTIDRQGTRPPADTGGPTSLRSALKAFYHHGVCLDAHWPYVDGEAGCGIHDLSPERLREARKLALGAYFRVQPVLNDFHAAINEVGALYAAAAIHEGWFSDAVSSAGGCIEPGTTYQGGHAFAIVGYDQEGFLVLNSWGEDWGGFGGIKGLGHWRYEDWALSILDAWVVHLAVPTPDAFEYSLGLQGIHAGMDTLVSASSTPRSQILGHYLHLDDGDHVSGGPYSSSHAMLEATVGLLEGQAQAGLRKYDHVLLWFAGSNEGTRDAVADIARLKPVWMGQRVYPITVLWCSDFVESVVDVLHAVFTASLQQVGRPGPDLDRVIEARVHGPGRAFLRDVKRSSARAAAGPLRAAMASLGRLTNEYRLHIATEGVGAILLADLAVPVHGAGPALPRLSSVTLLAPTLVDTRFKDLVRQLRRMKCPAPAVATADAASEKQMRVGPYRGSILRLVDHAFEEGPGPDRIVGLLNVAELVKVGFSRRDGPEFHTLAVDDVQEPQLRHLTRGRNAIKLVAARMGLQVPDLSAPRTARAL